MLARGCHAQVPERRQGGDAAARRALQVALLDEVGLDDVLDGAGLLADAGGDVVQPHRAAVEAVDDSLQQLSVHHVEALGVHIEHRQGALGDVLRDAAVALHVGIVAHAPQQAVGDAWGAARAARDLEGTLRIDGRIQQPGRPRDDARQLFGRVELQPRDDAEAVAQRVGEHAGAGGGADQGEGLQVELDAPRGRPLADHDVDLVVLQRGVEDFLHHGREAVDLVDEEDVVPFQVGQQRGQVFRLFQHRPAGLPQVHAELGRDDVAQRGLAQPGRAEQQHVVQRLLPLARGPDEDLELLARLGLADVFLQQLGPQRALQRLLLRGGGCGGNHALGRRGREIVGLDAHGRGCVSGRRCRAVSSSRRSTPRLRT